MYEIIVQVSGRFTMRFDDKDTALDYAAAWARRFGWDKVRMG